jgi:hypothetical protein
MRRLLWVGRITADPATTLHGPLCHGNVSMVGDTDRARVWLIGYGIANHAGKGSSRTLARVRAGTYAGQAPGPDDTDGNPRYFGLEYSHPGDGTTPWPDALLDCGHRAHCAYAEAAGWPRHEWPGRGVEHREWTTRKIDRRWPGDLRAAIARVSEEKDMPLTDDEIATIAKKSGDEVWGRIFNTPETGTPTVPADPHAASYFLRTGSGDKDGLNSSKLDALVKGQGTVTLTPDQVNALAAQIAPAVVVAVTDSVVTKVAAEVIAQLRAHPLTPKP